MILSQSISLAVFSSQWQEHWPLYVLYGQTYVRILFCSAGRETRGNLNTCPSRIPNVEQVNARGVCLSSYPRYGAGLVKIQCSNNTFMSLIALFVYSHNHFIIMIINRTLNTFVCANTGLFGSLFHYLLLRINYILMRNIFRLNALLYLSRKERPS